MIGYYPHHLIKFNPDNMNSINETEMEKTNIFDY